MNLFGWRIERETKSSGISLDTLIRRLEAAFETSSGIAISPDTAMSAPTVHAIVTAVSRRIASLPVHVLQKTTVAGRDQKEHLRSHPVQRLLEKPNDYQTRVNYWLDATSWLLRYGNFYAFKARGNTGPIRRLEPLHPSSVIVEQQDDLSVTYRVTRNNGEQQVIPPSRIHHVRGPARDGLKGDSPVMDGRESISMEIAAEQFGATWFANGALPGVIWKFAEGFQGFRSKEERDRFIEEFQEAYGQRKRFRAIVPPKGLEVGAQLEIDNEKAQFLELRRHQRTVIAGFWGIPPHLIGDLERATFSNIEHQSLEFVLQVVLPYVRMYEAAMERDLLTDQDRRDGVIIRFNIDAALRGDFKSRQEGLKIQREMGVISPNDWRENEGMNPIDPLDGGDSYWAQGPSGQAPFRMPGDDAISPPSRPNGATGDSDADASTG